jgi:hypothetical protein
MSNRGATQQSCNSSTAAELAQIYSRADLFEGASVGFNDIDSGTCGMTAAGVFDTYLGNPGWDFCSGVGSPLVISASKAAFSA